MEHGRDYCIDELVKRYQEGDEACGEEILRTFGCHPDDSNLTLYVGKYYNLLKYGKIDLKDRDSLEFVACFMPDREMLRKVAPFNTSRYAKENIMRTLNYIVKLVKNIEDEDLKQDLRMLLLIQAGRYEKRENDFTGYLYNSYRYAVKNHIQKMFKSKDPYLHMADDMVRFQDDMFKDQDEIVVKESLFAKAPMIQLEEALGNSWTRGITCGEEFLKLTPLQRLIIKLHYHDGIPDGKIAYMMGVHINTIFRQRKKAIRIVDETRKKLLEEDE